MRQSKIAISLAFAVGLAVLAGGPGSAGGTFAGDEGVIVYVDGVKSGKLVSIRPDGTEKTTLPLGSKNAFPSFSPDGGTLVFSCGKALCAAKPDGTKKKTLPRDGRQRWPGISADGDLLVYVKGKGTLVVARTNGKKPVELPEAGQAWQPEFTPDGAIVFSRKVGETREIWSIEPDGSGLEQITKGVKGFEDVNPSASPRGKTILYERHEHAFDIETGGVRSVKLNGKSDKEVIALAGTPAVSPTNQRFVFQDFREPTFHLAIAAKNGGGAEVLVDEGDLSHPAWQPTEP